MGSDEDMEARIARAVAAAVAPLHATIASMAGTISALTATIDRQTERFDAKGVAPALSTTTLREGFEAYEAAHRASRSWFNTANKLAPLVRLRGDLPAMKLTPKEWKVHRAQRLDEPTQYGTPPSEGTLYEEFAKAKGMLYWMAEEEQGLIPFSPLARARNGKRKGPKKSWLNELQIQLLLEAPEPKTEGARLRLRAFVLNKVDTGLRFQELRKIRRDRLQAVGPERWIAFIERTKNGKPHTIGLTRRGFEALQDIPEVIGSPFFFANPDSPEKKLFATSTMRNWYNIAVSSAKLNATVAEGEKRHTPHGLRRSAATAANNRGASLFEIQGMLNHSSPAITAQYVQRNAANAIKLAELMEAGAKAEQENARRGPKRADDHVAASKHTGNT